MFARIKYFIQRGKRGYSDRDLWDLGYYISWLMGNALDDYILNGYSYPVNMQDKEWQQTLRDMKAGFRAITAMDDLFWIDFEDYQKECKRLEKIRDKGLNLFIKHIGDLWD